MTASTLIAEAAQLGIKLWAEGAALRFRPKSAMTMELAAKLTASKTDVLQALLETSGSVPLQPRAITQQEAAFWISYLRDAGCRIELVAGVPAIDCPEGLATPARLRDWETNADAIKTVLDAEWEGAINRGAKRPSPPRSVPPLEIIADSVVLCPRCITGRVLRELRTMTGGLCYVCWESGPEARS